MTPSNNFSQRGIKQYENRKCPNCANGKLEKDVNTRTIWCVTCFWERDLMDFEQTKLTTEKREDDMHGDRQSI
jgi:hypothetical protein